MPFSGLTERLEEIRRRVARALARGGHGQHVEIVAVTKTHGAEAVVAAWEAGLRAVGENRVQEALPKMDETAEVPVQWHLIGHLQRNKARSAARFALVHSMDSVRLAQALHTVGCDRGEPLRVLVQVNTSGEGSKGGFSPGELRDAVGVLRGLDGVVIQGVMTMAPLEADEATLRSTFGGARDARELLREAGFPAAELSMGMSGDFEIAIEEGATMVRLGTILFGERVP